MKDLTKALGAYGEAKANSEKAAHDREVEHIRRTIDTITAFGEDMDIAIRNANAAIAAGIKLERNWTDFRDCFESGDFYADGIKHRLGFIKNDGRNRVVGLGVIGGGWNGNVSVVYKNGEVIYDEDKYTCHNKAFMNCHKLETMNDQLLGHYKRAFTTFASDLSKFMECFEDYLEREIRKGAML